jgi:sulfopropanediol 3-dehydrogenase
MRYIKQPPPTPKAVTREIRETVSEIISAVESEGLTAVRRYSERFDKWNPPSFRVSSADIERAITNTPQDWKNHIGFLQAQVKNFAELQKATLTEFEVETHPGIRLGQKQIPVSSVGSYSPGGRYPLIASSAMTVVVPKVAGVRRVVASAPPRDQNGIYAAQLYTMHTSGADEIYSIGGVQAMAAFAFGVPELELEPTDMIVGAGNAYVAEAKRQLFGVCGIDLLAGPTDILIIADESADPNTVAIDLLGQAEHGLNSPATLVTTSEKLALEVQDLVQRILEVYPTQEVASVAWRDCGSIIVCDDREEMVHVSDAHAPEHLEVQTTDPDWYLARLQNYGSVFLGHEATVAYSDKAIGTNHVLPTGGAARYTGGLWVGKFTKTVTFQRCTLQGSQTVAPHAGAVSRAELMFGHALSCDIRLEPDKAGFLEKVKSSKS